MVYQYFLLALHDLGASAGLTALVEGEALLNDGSAFVAFVICLQYVEGLQPSIGASITTFLQLAIGGPLWGILMGIVSFYWLKLVWNDFVLEIGIIIVFVFSLYFIGDVINSFFFSISF